MVYFYIHKCIDYLDHINESIDTGNPACWGYLDLGKNGSIIELPAFWTRGLLVYWTHGLLDRWTIKLMDYGTIGHDVCYIGWGEKTCISVAGNTFM